MDESYKLKIEYVPLDKLKPYERNARKHGDKDIDAIAASIKRFGFKDPIGVWGKDIIVEGHGRLLAAKKLNLAEVPIIRLDDLTDEERRMYALAHNKTAELSAWDFDTLFAETEELSNVFDISEFGFDSQEDIAGAQGSESKYTSKINVPQYEIRGEMPKVSDLYKADKANLMIDKIEAADLPDEVKSFLKMAAYRHVVFNYQNIAEFYAHQSPEVQELMEESALVIIDIDNAIANGYVKLEQTIMDELADED